MSLDLSAYDKTYIINVDKRIDDGIRVKELLHYYYAKNITKIIVGDGKLLDEYQYTLIDENPPADWTGRRQSWNYYNSLFFIIKDAKSNGYNSILLAEDDVAVREQLASSETFEYPKDWDMVYYGGGHHTRYGSKEPPQQWQFISKNCYRSYLHLGMFLTGINHTMYDTLLNAQKDYTWLCKHPYADVAIGNEFHHKINCYSFHPAPAYEQAGYSYNENRFINREEW